MSDGNNWDGDERRSGPRATSALERHAQTALSVLVTAGVIWVGSSVIDLGKEQIKTGAVTGIKLEQLQRDVTALQAQLLQQSLDRVTISDVRRLEERIDRLERKK